MASEAKESVESKANGALIPEIIIVDRRTKHSFNHHNYNHIKLNVSSVAHFFWKKVSK